MLAWLVEEVGSPYGTVATLHWAVPDEMNDGGASSNVGALNSTALQVELESAEDQLGAVLWNSNPAALAYLHTHVFGLPATATAEARDASSTSSSSSPPLVGKNIVELGAGVGCLGIALAMAGARVAVTDMKELLPLMAHNVRLNAKRVQNRSHGAGYCTALQWKWGPTVTTSVHKQLQKELKASAGPAAAAAVVDRVTSTMVKSLAKPSAALEECNAALAPTTGPTTTPVLPYHYVVMCDALYGNPKDWPALLYTLTELLSTNPDGCEIINFCEQRVNDVEGAFLKLLEEENARAYVPASQRDTVGDPLWTAVKDSAQRCCASSAVVAVGKKGAVSSGATSSSAAAVDLQKAREEAANALLSYALVQRRGGYRWTYTTEVVAEAQSELNMVIRASRIRWTKVSGSSPAESRRRPREAAVDGGDRTPHDTAADSSNKKKKKTAH